MKLEGLKIRSIRVRAVAAPMKRPLTTSTGALTVAPLLLIDLQTDGGVVGRSYLFGIAKAHLAPLAKLVEAMAEMLKDVPLLRREQYMDFLRSRMFRCSLLCHPDLVPNYRMPSNNLLEMHVSLLQPLVSSPGEKPEEVVWKHPTGKITIDERLNGLLGDDGITNCGNAQNCLQVCPMSIPLTRAIYDTNRDITVNALFGWLKK